MAFNPVRDAGALNLVHRGDLGGVEIWPDFGWLNFRGLILSMIQMC